MGLGADVGWPDNAAIAAARDRFAHAVPSAGRLASIVEWLAGTQGAFPPTAPAPGVELAYNVRSPAEVDAVLAEARSAGGSIVRPAAPANWGGYTGAFADPEGYVWEVAHNPDWKLTEDGSVRLP